MAEKTRVEYHTKERLKMEAAQSYCHIATAARFSTEDKELISLEEAAYKAALTVIKAYFTEGGEASDNPE